MKTLISILTIFIPFILRAQINNIYTLEGKTNKPTTVTIEYSVEGKVLKNTAEVKNGKINLTGNIDRRIQANLIITPSKTDKNNTSVMGTMVRFWLEPGNIKVANLDSVQKGINFSGTPLNDETNELADKKKVLAGLPDGKEKEGAIKSVSVKFIKTHPNSLVSLIELDYTLSRGVPDLLLVETLFSGLSDKIKSSKMGLDYQKKLNNWKNVDIGSQAPDFEQTDKNGKAVKLSNFRGKYILIDFWASWCHPCRDENPNLIKQYEMYKNKGFEILSISLDGGNKDARENWLKAIKDDKVGAWIHVCELVKDAKNKVRLQYGVGSIPESFLIDPDGKIIAKSLRGEVLNAKLKEIFDGVTAQNNSIIRIDEVLPLDTAVLTGKLANGFTYYIRKNNTPKKQAVFYLVNKVGSILETDNQRGLAHFMEHMNFNGTTHFPKNELVSYLQKAGVRFGADINAYTGFNETVYQLPLPTDKPEVIRNGIQIMRDWAQEALLDPEEINKERGVILEEKRGGKGAGTRIQEKTLPMLMNHSRYAERLPIGIDSIIQNFKPETLKQFYKDWYRPNLQALIVVGDVDVNEMENIIKAKFADLKNPANAPERKEYLVSLTGQNQFMVITDPEIAKTQVVIRIKHQEPPLKTIADYKRYVIEGLFNDMLRDRTQQMSDAKNNPPYIFASASIGNFITGIDNYFLSFETKQGQLEKSFKSLWIETERLKRYGFLQQELDDAKKALLERMERSLEESDTKGSTQYANAYLQYFINGTAEPGLAMELQLAKQYLPAIGLNDLLAFTKQYLGNTNIDIVITAPESEKLNLPNEKQVNQWMDAVSKETIENYKNQSSNKSLLIKEPIAGKVINESKIKAINATEWTLSNGAKVILKPTDFKQNDISLIAFAKGGSSVYTDADFPSATYAPTIFSMSGLGTYSYSELSKFLGTKNLGVFNGIDDYESIIGGFSGLKDFELLLQVVHAKMAEPVYSKDAFKGFMEMNKINPGQKEKSPEEVFTDTLIKVLYNNSIRKKSADSTFMALVDLDKAYKIYKEQYGNAANFTFVFTGSFDLEKMKPLVEKYIASLPSNKHKLEIKNLGIQPPSRKLTKQVYKGLEEKSSVSLNFNNAYTFNAANNKLLDALKEILLIKLTNRLREEESGTYSPSVAVSYNKIPEESYRLRIRFDCAPENVNKLIAATLDEIEKLKTNGANEDMLVKFKAEDLAEHQKAIIDNQFWANYIKNQLLNEQDWNELNNYSNLIKSISSNQIKNAAQEYLKSDNLIQFILLPEKSKP